MRPKVDVRKIDHGWAELQKRIKELAKGNPYVKAGVIGRQASEVHPDAESTSGKAPRAPITNVQLALIQEFGTDRIPERSFVRGTFHIHRDEYRALLRRVLGAVLDGKMELHQAFTVLGLKMQTDMQSRIANRGEPEPWAPNAPSTIAMKGSDVPLVDSGRLNQSISYEVVLTGGAE